MTTEPRVSYSCCGTRRLDGIRALCDAVAAERRWIGTEPGYDVQAYHAGWERLHDPRTGVLLVACDAKSAALVGSLSLRRTQEQHGEIGLLVDSRHRRCGIGTQLLRACTAWARMHDVIGLTLLVFPHNVAARERYVREGFIETERLERQVNRQNGEVWDTIRMMKDLRLRARLEGGILPGVGRHT